jgi:hypothetical protein
MVGDISIPDVYDGLYIPKSLPKDDTESER